MPYFDDVPLAPPDAIFHLTASYNNDTDNNKINVGVGAYRDDDGKPWVLPVVKQVEHLIVNNHQLDHEYLPIQGLSSFTTAATKLILGSDCFAIQDKRVASVQTISGTGAVRLAADFLNLFCPTATVYLSNPTWANHKSIFRNAGFKHNIREYTYYDATTRGLNIDAMINDLNNAPSESIIILHACAHNPTGVDPTINQWKLIAQVIADKHHIVLFDSAYQGFASGDIDRDAEAVRYFCNYTSIRSIFIAQSFAKNFGLYNERCGNLSIITKSMDTTSAIYSQLLLLQRGNISNPPAFGARIVSTILNDINLYNDWIKQLQVMANRIKLMRQQLYDYLIQLQTPGSWKHILDQIGMFSFTGLNVNQAQTMKTKFHIYMTDNGRISMAGLTTKNIKYFAESMDWVVRNVQ